MDFFRSRAPLVLIGLLILLALIGIRRMLPPGKLPADKSGRIPLELGKTLWITRVQPPGGEPQDYVTMLPPKETFARGIIPEAIVGVLKKPIEEGETIQPENFARNKVFNQFLHEMIALHGPRMEGLQAEARRQGEGWVYLLDARTATPQGKIPPRDIFGSFEVKDGRLVHQSYKRNQGHVLLSPEGFFQLPTELHEELLKELTDRNAKLKL